MRVLVFGDSIAYGAWDTEGGWVERLKREAHLRTVQSEGTHKRQIINLGIGGDTSTGILKRLQNEIEARRSTSWPFMFIITCGTNDQRKDDGSDTVKISLEQYEENIKKIAAIAGQYTDHALFLGLPPIAEPIVMLKASEYSDERIKAYDEKLESLVTSLGLPFLPVRPAFEESGVEGLFYSDGIHPNDQGHELIAGIVRNYLEREG